MKLCPPPKNFLLTIFFASFLNLHPVLAQSNSDKIILNSLDTRIAIWEKSLLNSEETSRKQILYYEGMITKSTNPKVKKIYEDALAKWKERDIGKTARENIAKLQTERSQILSNIESQKKVDEKRETEEEKLLKQARQAEEKQAKEMKLSEERRKEEIATLIERENKKEDESKQMQGKETNKFNVRPDDISEYVFSNLRNRIPFYLAKGVTSSKDEDNLTDLQFESVSREYEKIIDGVRIMPNGEEVTILSKEIFYRIVYSSNVIGKNRIRVKQRDLSEQSSDTRFLYNLPPSERPYFTRAALTQLVSSWGTPDPIVRFSGVTANDIGFFKRLRMLKKEILIDGKTEREMRAYLVEFEGCSFAFTVKAPSSQSSYPYIHHYTIASSTKVKEYAMCNRYQGADKTEKYKSWLQETISELSR